MLRDLREQPVPPRNSANLCRCTQSRRSGSRWPTLPTRFPKPLRQSLLHFGVAENTTRICVIQALLNLLSDVDVILDVLEGGILGKHLENLFDLILGCLHDEFNSTGYWKLEIRSRRSPDHE